MKNIIPHLWFDKEAREATKFYTSLFPDSSVTNTTELHDTPSGDCDVITFELWKQKFMAINAGPLFKFNPSVSFIVCFDPLLFGTSPAAEQVARERLDTVWAKLSEGGTALMPLSEYPFSRRYGWIMGKYGLSWQLMLPNPERERRPAITTSLMFVGSKCGKAEEAIKFYLSVFKDAKMGALHRYGKGQEPEKEDNVTFADFAIGKTWFAAMDSAREHKFDFNEAISFIVQCADQKEIDYYWQKLSAFPEQEQCGWLKDKYGVSWQITPVAMEEMMTNGTQEQIERLTQAFLPMKKLDLAKLQEAYDGKRKAPPARSIL
jgi:predicted 3-demethylubiquinone-9 3-methyltransferase (glyoxalase superfamily)